MSTERDVDRIVRSWLDEGVNVLPDRVLDAVLDQLPATPQRRASWLARRFPLMNNTIRVAAVAAVVLVAVVVTFSLLNRDGTGGPSPTATPIPTPAPTLPFAGTVAPGSYRDEFITFTVPAGWQSYQGEAVNKLGGDPPNGMAVWPWQGIATVYGDPCHWQTTAHSVGPTVDNVVAALVAQTRGASVTPLDVTIDGFGGKQVDLMVPLDVSIAACDAGTYKSWTDTTGGDRYNQGAGQHDLVDVLDVNGQTRVILRIFYPANTAADLAELKAIFDSIRITP